MTRRTNTARALEARQLCDKIGELAGADELRFQVSDILCNLMHLCRLVKDEDGNAVDFAEWLETARINFEAECEEDPDQ